LRHGRTHRFFLQEGVMTAVDDILMFCCMSAFFAGIAIAVGTLPV
jgi:hypothetical protein